MDALGLPMHLFKRVINRFYGNGPSGVVRPFAEIAALQSPDFELGIRSKERLAGVVRESMDAPFLFTAPILLERTGPRAASLGTDLFDPQILVPALAPPVVRRLYSLTPGAVLGETALVYDPETRVSVRESLRLWDAPISSHPSFSAPFVPSARRQHGLCLSLGTVSSVSFYHFLLEVLAKVALAQPFLSEVDCFLMNGPRREWMEAWLRLAGVPPRKVRWMEPLENVRCEQLLFTNNMARHTHPSLSSVEDVRSLFSSVQAAQTSKRRLWVSRRDASSRQLLWESELLAQLSGFESVVLSELPPEEQLRLMREADVLAGVHGAGLSLAAFLSPGAQVIEFQDSDWPVHSLYSRLGSLCGIRHGIVRISLARRSELGWLNAIIGNG